MVCTRRASGNLTTNPSHSNTSEPPPRFSFVEGAKVTEAGTPDADLKQAEAPNSKRRSPTPISDLDNRGERTTTTYLSHFPSALLSMHEVTLLGDETIAAHKPSYKRKHQSRSPQSKLPNTSNGIAKDSPEAQLPSLFGDPHDSTMTTAMDSDSKPCLGARLAKKARMISPTPTESVDVNGDCIRSWAQPVAPCSQLQGLGPTLAE